MRYGVREDRADGEIVERKMATRASMIGASHCLLSEPASATMRARLAVKSFPGRTKLDVRSDPAVK